MCLNLGCHDKNQTKPNNQPNNNNNKENIDCVVWLKQQFISLEAENSKIKVPADPVSGESTLLGLQMVISSLYPHIVGE